MTLLICGSSGAICLGTHWFVCLFAFIVGSPFPRKEMSGGISLLPSSRAINSSVHMRISHQMAKWVTTRPSTVGGDGIFRVYPLSRTPQRSQGYFRWLPCEKRKGVLPEFLRQSLELGWKKRELNKWNLLKAQRGDFPLCMFLTLLFGVSQVNCTLLAGSLFLISRWPLFNH